MEIEWVFIEKRLTQQNKCSLLCKSVLWFWPSFASKHFSAYIFKEMKWLFWLNDIFPWQSNGLRIQNGYAEFRLREREWERIWDVVHFIVSNAIFEYCANIANWWLHVCRMCKLLGNLISLVFSDMFKTKINDTLLDNLWGIIVK